MVLDQGIVMIRYKITFDFDENNELIAFSMYAGTVEEDDEYLEELFSFLLPIHREKLHPTGKVPYRMQP